MASRPWVLGWALGGLVVLVAAGLLLELIARGRRITRQAREIESAIDGARAHTDALYELTRSNAALERAVSALRDARRRASAR
jgi:hypothetical protein